MDQTTANLIEQNLIDLCILSAEVSGGDNTNGKYYSWAFNPYVDSYSKVFRINIPEDQIPGVIKDLSGKIEKGLAPGNLMIPSSGSPALLEKHLEHSNFQMFYHQTGMAVNPENLQFDENWEKVRIIDSVKELKEWVFTVNDAFNKERNGKLFELLLKEKEILFYGCFERNEMAATLMSYLKDGICGIHLVGTKMDYRGKGFGSLITRKALQDAKKNGCQYAVLQASDMGKKIYRDIGFREYGIIRHWKFQRV